MVRGSTHGDSVECVMCAEASAAESVMVIMKSVTATRMSVATGASIPAATTAMPGCSTPCLAVADVTSQIVIDVFDFLLIPPIMSMCLHWA